MCGQPRGILMTYIFRTLASVISIYTLLCFIRIVLTWIPDLAYSKFAQFLAAICDPFLNLFRRITWLKFSAIDFTPIIAFGVLMFLSTVFNSMATQHMISFGNILAILLTMLWEICSSVLMLFIVFLIIRLIVMLIGRDSNYYGSIWTQIDNSINPFVFRISGVFSGGKPISYKNAIIIAILTLFVVQIGGAYLIHILANMLRGLPF